MKNYILILVLALYGCSHNPQNKDGDFDFTSFAPQKELKGTELQLGELQLPKKICIAGDKLLLINHMTPKFISIYNLNTKAYIGDLLSNGRADNEVLAVDNMYVNPAESLFAINDIMSGKLLIYEIAGLDNPQNLKPKQIIKTADRCDNLYLLKGGKLAYIPATLNSSDRIKIVDTLNHECNSYAPYPVIDKTQTETCGYELFMPHFVVNTDESRIAIFNKNADIIDIYTTDGLQLCSKSGPGHFSPQYSIESEDESLTVRPIKDQSRMAYFNAINRGNKIWVMYNGGFRTQRLPSKYILTFSWDGEPLDCYLMNDGLIDFDVDTMSSTIYGLHQTKAGEHRVVSYKY